MSDHHAELVRAGDELEDSFSRLWAGLYAVQPYLDKPLVQNPRWTWWTRFVEQELDHTQGREPDVRPTFEMSLQMWDAFTKAILESEHIRTDAIDIVAKTLELEQQRVNELLKALIQPPVVIQTDREPRRAR